MLAVLNRSIVTDYTPAFRPPWVLVALFIAALTVAAPRDLLPAVLVVSGLSVVLGMVVDWICEMRNWRKQTTREADSTSDSGSPEL